MLLRIIFIFFFHLPLGYAADAIYLPEQTSTLRVVQRTQQQLGFGSGYIVSDFEGATLMSPFFEVGLKLRFLARYGGVISNSFAAVGGGTTSGTDFSFGGYDRPVIRARQLVYGNFHYGRWFLVDLGLAAFNTAGYTSELFRYWSSRVGLHESLRGAIVSPIFELAFTLRSLTQFAEPSHLGLIYPPSVDVSAGFSKEVFDLFESQWLIKFEQALANTQIAGSYNASAVPPLGSPTYVVLLASLDWKLNKHNSFMVSYSNRTFRWPDNDSSALWQFFEEGYYGQAFSIAWRGQW